LRSIATRWRARAVKTLELTPGVVVLDVACGTGVNLPLLQRYLHGSGRIIATDYSDAMLRRAVARTQKQGWLNIDCVQADAARLDRRELEKARALEPGQHIDAAICTFGLSVIPDWEMAYAALRSLVRPGGRLAIMDVNSPQGCGSGTKRYLLRLLWRFLCWLGRADANRKPWLSLAHDLQDVVEETFSSGFVVVASGTVPPTGES